MNPLIPVAGIGTGKGAGPQAMPAPAQPVVPQQTPQSAQASVLLERIANGMGQMQGLQIDTKENDKAYKQVLMQQLADKDPLAAKKIGQG